MTVQDSNGQYTCHGTAGDPRMSADDRDHGHDDRERADRGGDRSRYPGAVRAALTLLWGPRRHRANFGRHERFGEATVFGAERVRGVCPSELVGSPAFTCDREAPLMATSRIDPHPASIRQVVDLVRGWHPHVIRPDNTSESPIVGPSNREEREGLPVLGCFVSSHEGRKDLVLVHSSSG
jgi:hypothetical protein